MDQDFKFIGANDTRVPDGMLLTTPKRQTYNLLIYRKNGFNKYDKTILSIDEIFTPQSRGIWD